MEPGRDFDQEQRDTLIRASTAQHGYPTAPMSTLLLEGQRPDLVFQKSLNTLSKRHHIRIWQRPETYEGRPLWVGAATHDTGFKLRMAAFTHQIDPFIDRERRKVVDDLNFAGCIGRAHILDRPNIAHLAIHDIVTDGRMAAVSLRDCEPQAIARWGEYPPAAHGSLFKRFVRRLILEGRHSVVRGNIYYWGCRLGRQSVSMVRDRRSPSAGAMGLRPID